MDLFEKCQNYHIADDAREKGIYPYFHCLESRQAPEVIMEGKRRIMLGSNNYLGLTTQPCVMKAAEDAIEKYGTGCSGSRFLNGTLDLHLKLEKEVASFLSKDDAVSMPTGFQTNLGIISSLCGRGDYVICDRENHASIYDGCKLSYAEMLRYRHNDMENLEMMLSKAGNAGKLIVTDGVFSMSGDIANLPAIVELAHKYNARIMVDDSHGIGTIGSYGKGTASYWGLEDQVDIIMGTFSKSLASLGGFAAGKARVIDFIRHTSRPFIFSASIPPASAASALAALEYMEQHPQIVGRLKALSDYFRAALKSRDVRFKDGITPVVPIYTTDDDTTLRIAKILFDEGVYVNPVLPPATAENECLIRTSMMATLTEPLLDEAASIIADVLSRTIGKESA
ncbi:MAG: aminotransferase class I/II-fold pyridoxal phosphate-dependent enzyme [Sphaerochaetaceae bacterium]